MNWQELSTTSHYQTALKVENELLSGNIKNAAAGIRALIEALGRSEKRALKSQLIRLMMHVIKWKMQPERRSRSWAASICNAREEISDIQEETPSLSDSVIKNMWDKCFKAAKREAEGEMNKKVLIDDLSWEDVFESGCEFE
ncbi:DUF29 [Desulfonema limicola]|uniref:DUF29 n=1 Tax=Desulfonema limicola TaxID=45656 RepID=A0A975GFS6_9BACT|nr:DUF29 domain-containing protein [Desulfonema limicola]QTA79484.1 DUF29 [Desulfonema limicola]